MIILTSISQKSLTIAPEVGEAWKRLQESKSSWMICGYPEGNNNQLVVSQPLP
jgi:hypothetical protein